MVFNKTWRDSSVSPTQLLKELKWLPFEMRIYSPTHVPHVQDLTWSCRRAPHSTCRTTTYATGHRYKYQTIPTFGILARAVLSCVLGKNAGSYGCCWGAQCRQAPIPRVACVLILINFYQIEVSSFVITCTYLLPQMIIIFKSQQY